MQLQVWAPRSASAVRLVWPSGAHPTSHLPLREGQTDGILGHEVSWPRVTSALGPQTLSPPKEVPKPPILLPALLRTSLQGRLAFLTPLSSSSLNFWQFPEQMAEKSKTEDGEKGERASWLIPGAPSSPSVCPPGWG